MRLLSSLQDAKAEVVSSQRQDEAPEEEVTRGWPGDALLEQADYLTGPQDLGCQEAQTPEALSGGSEGSQSLKGVFVLKLLSSRSLLESSTLYFLSVSCDAAQASLQLYRFCFTS